MILILTTSYCFSANAVVEIFKRLSLPTFRLDVDRYWEYKFLFSDNQFEIVNTQGDILHSHEINYVVIYKARLPIDEEFHPDLNITDVKWVRSTLNYVVSSLARWAIQKSFLKLWTPYEIIYPKTFQMDIAKKNWVMKGLIYIPKVYLPQVMGIFIVLLILEVIQIWYQKIIFL